MFVHMYDLRRSTSAEYHSDELFSSQEKSVMSRVTKTAAVCAAHQAFSFHIEVVYWFNIQQNFSDKQVRGCSVHQSAGVFIMLE